MGQNHSRDHMDKFDILTICIDRLTFPLIEAPLNIILYLNMLVQVQRFSKHFSLGLTLTAEMFVLACTLALLHFISFSLHHVLHLITSSLSFALSPLISFPSFVSPLILLINSSYLIFLKKKYNIRNKIKIYKKSFFF